VLFDGATKEGTLEVKDLTFAEEATRTSDPGEANVLETTEYKILNVPKTGTLVVPVPDEPPATAVLQGYTTGGAAGRWLLLSDSFLFHAACLPAVCGGGVGV
jgi:hypothetical protein